MKKIMMCIVLLGLAGCATIMGDKTQLLGIKSTPDAALIKITDEKGSQVFDGKTPTTVTLQKGDGSYFGGKTYQVSITKEGYKPATVTLNSKVNGWYVGNILFGGLIGWLIVDPFTGAMYNLKPENIDTQLSAQGVSGTADEDGLHIVLLEDIPSPVRHRLERIN